MKSQFFYSGQVRRFLNQFIRIMSHFSVEFGTIDPATNTYALQQVPVYYGDPSRQTMAAIIGGSENALPSCPAMAIYISGFDYDRERVQDPTFIGKINIRQREYDSTTDTWGHGQGNAFTIERPMPVPYKLTLKVDIWSSNKEQKLQILEQVCSIFNPDFEIQNTDNYLDWTSLTTVRLTGTTWTSRSIPQGASDSIDISTLTFELPIWISMPAKVMRLGIVQKIVASLYNANGELTNDLENLPVSFLLSQQVITPMNYGIVYMANPSNFPNGTLQLIRQSTIVTETVDGTVVTPSNNVDSWKTLIDSYGLNLVAGTSQVQLTQPNNNVVVGTVVYHPTDSSMLLFNPNIDTVPTNTLDPLNAIIDPYNMPVGSTFINPTGPYPVRYMILNDIGPAQAWGNITAKENDIISYNGSVWSVAFSAATKTSISYVTNLKSGLQFKWLPIQQVWTRSIEGKYDPGFWTIVLSTLS